MGDIRKYISEHDHWRGNCLNMVASENVISDFVKQGFSSDFGHRYFFFNAFSTDSGLSYEYRGTKFVKELYHHTVELANEIFGSEYVNLDMHSGHLSNLNILMSFCKPGDTIICSDTEFGGYPGLADGKLPSYLGITPLFLPQTSIGGEVDLVKLEKLLEKHAPKIVMLSSSVTLFPFRVKEVTELCRKYGVPFCYDASHPLGLIAGGQFQKPFEEGADLMIGSTHKSFPGPQGGIILGRRGLSCRNIQDSTDFVTVDNIHLHRIAAMSLALYETKHFGADYAKQIVSNTKALAVALENAGFNVHFKDRGYSESHQLLLDISDLNYPDLTARFEACNIITDNSGRLGTSEMTRYGLKEADMQSIAELISRVAAGEDLEKIKKDVLEFRSNYQEVKFTFNI